MCDAICVFLVPGTTTFKPYATVSLQVATIITLLRQTRNKRQSQSKQILFVVLTSSAVLVTFLLSFSLASPGGFLCDSTLDKFV